MYRTEVALTLSVIKHELITEGTATFTLATEFTDLDYLIINLDEGCHHDPFTVLSQGTMDGGSKASAQLEICKPYQPH